jgi:antitoxin ParD1/3/4
MRTSKPITVTLGRQQASVDARLASGAYDSASEVMRAALRALDRSPRSCAPRSRKLLTTRVRTSRKALRAHHADRMKTSKRDT